MTRSDSTHAVPHFRRPAVSVILLSALTAIVAATFALADARSRGLLFNTFWLTSAAVGIAVPGGFFLGLVLARTDVWGRRAAMVSLGGLLLVPLYLHAAAWQAGFGIEGWQTAQQAGDVRVPWLDGWRGAIWVHACAGVPWVALFVGLAAYSIPRPWEEAALLDVSMTGVFCRVTLRQALPAVLLATLWVAVTIMTEMSVTDLFAVRTYAEELYVELNLGSWNAVMGTGPPETGEAPTLAGMVVTAIAAAGAVIVARGAMVRPRTASVARPLVYTLGRWRGWVSLVTWTVMSVLVLLPLGSLIYKAGSFVVSGEAGYTRGWSAWKAIATTLASPADHSQEFGWSLLMAVASAGLALLIAVPLAYASRRSRSAGATILLLAVAGLALPGPLIGLGLITFFHSWDWPGVNYLYDRTVAAPVVAQTLRAVPLTLFLVWHALRTIPDSLIEAALLDGAGRLRRIWLAVRQRPAAIALAGLAAAIVSLGEIAATILVVPPGIEPLSVRVFGLLHYNVEDQVAAISLMLILLHAAAAWIILAVGRRAFRVG